MHTDLGDIVDANRQDDDKVKDTAVIDAYPASASPPSPRHSPADSTSAKSQMTSAGDKRVPVIHICVTSRTGPAASIR